MARTGDNIYKRSDGRYEGRYIKSRDENGKAIYAYVYGHTREEVLETLTEKKGVVKEGPMAGRKFREVALEWLEAQGHLSPVTKDQYRTVLERHIFPEIGDMEMREVSAAEAEHLVRLTAGKKQDMDGSGAQGKSSRKGDAKAAGKRKAVGNGTLQRIRDITERVLEYASGKKLAGSRMDLHVVPENPYKPLSQEEIRKVCRCARENRTPEMLAVLLVLYSGIRVAEACALSCDDVYPETREIYVHCSVHRVSDKSPDAKKKTENRVMELPRKGRIKMLEYPEALEGFVEEFHRPGRMLLTGLPGQPMEPRTLQRRVNRALEGHGLAPVPFLRFQKTFTAGMADLGILEEAFAGKKRMKPHDGALD
ncbi:MAG: tyrosine-type recombinase/integrase family protein, partial [Lachnospiraceae bacterium]|nr:tyrosine-type recombinase/integrase family protein [Lachnospiraceae bacterium]